MALLGSLWIPEQSFVWRLLDKNDPTTGFIFDLTGILLILGLVLSFIRGRRRSLKRVEGLPAQDLSALGLIGAVVLVGFVLEGMRMAMTGMPDGSSYAFAGYALATLFFEGANLTGIYGYVWYAHAVLTGAFVAYLPFSRLLHVIMAPIVLAVNAAADAGTRERE